MGVLEKGLSRNFSCFLPKAGLFLGVGVRVGGPGMEVAWGRREARQSLPATVCGHPGSKQAGELG